MSKLFAYDNPIWVFMGKVADVMILSFFWFIFSLPIITIGASTSALFYTTLKLVENREGYLFKTFLKGFKESFGQSTVIWIMLGIIGGIISYSLYQYQRIGSQMALTLTWSLIVIAFIYLLFFSVIFALVARLSTGIPNLFMMTFMVCMKHFSWVLFMAVALVCMIAAAVFVFWPLLIITPGAVAYLNSAILVKFVFPKYGWNLKTLDKPDEYASEDETPDDSSSEISEASGENDTVEE